MTTIETTRRIIAQVIRVVPGVLPNLSVKAKAIFRAGADYTGVRNTYWAEIYDAVYEYLTGNQAVTSFKNRMKKAMADAFVNAAEIGYQDAGGELPLDDDTLSWLGGAQDEELGYIDDLFSRLKAEWDGIDPIAEAFARADGYSATLDSIFNQAKLYGSKNIVLEFGGDDGVENCATCAKLKGQRHKISWWLDNELVPGIPGNSNYICNGYNCQHYLFNPKTGEQYVV